MASQQDIYGATMGRAVTPADATLLPVTRGLYIGGDGNLSVVWADSGSAGTAVTITGVKGGSFYPFQVLRVMTATTATGIVALY